MDSSTGNKYTSRPISEGSIAVVSGSIALQLPSFHQQLSDFPPDHTKGHRAVTNTFPSAHSNAYDLGGLLLLEKNQGWY